MSIFYKDLGNREYVFTKEINGITIHLNSQEISIGGGFVIMILFAGTIAVLIAAAKKDVRSSRIPNILLIALILIQGISETLSLILFNETIIEGTNLIFGVITILILFPFFLCKELGAGDCKLIGLTTMSTKSPGLFVLLVFTIAALEGLYKIIVKKEKRSAKVRLGVPVLLAYLMAVICDLQKVT